MVWTIDVIVCWREVGSIFHFLFLGELVRFGGVLFGRGGF